ncbi:hypothetical protein DL765_010295 [Monosporascus sp. GIB2]|nr:hypothetical protein DL765_010295 [Monosporascus sp. GIB2]
MAANLNLAWLKLNEYYTKLEETPIYVTALALHPAYRWRWFERNWADHPEWIQHARDQVEDVWLEGYAHIEVPRAEHARPAKRAKRYYNELQQHLEQSRYGPSTRESDDSRRPGSGAHALLLQTPIHSCSSRNTRQPAPLTAAQRKLPSELELTVTPAPTEPEVGETNWIGILLEYRAANQIYLGDSAVEFVEEAAAVPGRPSGPVRWRYQARIEERMAAPFKTNFRNGIYIKYYVYYHRGTISEFHASPPPWATPEGLYGPRY